MQDRLITQRLVEGNRSVLLLGPRQVGKSTLCRKLLHPRRVIDLADEEKFLTYAKDPARLRRELESEPLEGLILIDEVQRVPALLNMVQVLVDRPGSHLRFMLTGSSARKWRRNGTNLLPGRLLLEHLDPLCVLELPKRKGQLDVALALQVGTLPGIYLPLFENRPPNPEAIDVLGTYAEIYLREEIRAEALAKDIGSFARFLDVAAILSGQWINFSKVSSDTDIPKETVRRYFSLLEDTLVAFRVPAFQPRRQLSRRVSQRDKFFLFDIGVRNALLGLHRRPVSPDQLGNVFEQWLVLQVIYLNRALKLDWRLSCYRTDAGAEVDLVVERSDEIIGIEIKAGRQVNKTDFRGLESLAETVGRYKPVRSWVLYRGTERQSFGPLGEAIPFEDGLRDLVSAGE